MTRPAPVEDRRLGASRSESGDSVLRRFIRRVDAIISVHGQPPHHDARAVVVCLAGAIAAAVEVMVWRDEFECVPVRPTLRYELHPLTMVAVGSR